MAPRGGGQWQVKNSGAAEKPAEEGEDEDRGEKIERPQKGKKGEKGNRKRDKGGGKGAKGGGKNSWSYWEGYDEGWWDTKGWKDDYESSWWSSEQEWADHYWWGGKSKGKGKGKGDRWDGGDRKGGGEGGGDRDDSRARLASGPNTYGFGDGEDAFWNWPYAISSIPPPAPLWREYFDSEGVPYYYNSKSGLCQWERPADLELSSASSKLATVSGGAGSLAEVGAQLETAKKEKPERRDGNKGDQKKGEGGKGANQRGGKRRGGKQAEKPEKEAEFGPPGCNLFVFHLPDDWTDADLHEYFAPHGSVISAKVMKELGTGRSRGFGFVSYEDRVSAATAIKKMQGYKILGKRLKVEFKKGDGEDDNIEELAADKKNNFPDDERLIGYLRAISAKNQANADAKEGERGIGGEGDQDRGGGDADE